MLTNLFGVVHPVVMTILVPLLAYAEASQRGEAAPWVGAAVLFVFLAVMSSFLIYSIITAPKLE